MTTKVFTEYALVEDLRFLYRQAREERRERRMFWTLTCGFLAGLLLAAGSLAR